MLGKVCLAKARWPSTSSQMMGFSWWQATSCHLIPETQSIKKCPHYLIIKGLTVAVKVVEHSHTRLGLSAQLGLLPVVGLGLGAGTESEIFAQSDKYFLTYFFCLNIFSPSGGWPVVEGGPAVCGRQPGLVGWPEPAVDVLGEEVRSVTTVKVAQTPGSPEIRHIHWKWDVNGIMIQGLY